MRAMRYMIVLKEGIIPELSIFIENHNNKAMFVFINQIVGSFMMDVKTGKERLKLIDKASAEVFDVSVDNYLILDLLDALENVHQDTVALMKRYFKPDPAAKKPEVKVPDPEQSVAEEVAE